MSFKNLHLTINVTDRCNLSCGYCPLEKGTSAISYDALDKIQKLILNSSFERVSIAYHGGEPLLEWDKISYLTDNIRSSGFSEAKFFICTNGLEITKERARYLSENTFQARVSCDGMPASQFAYRLKAATGADSDREYDYSRIVRGILTLRRAGVETSINMVVSPETVGSLADNFIFLDRLNVDFIHVNPVMGMAWRGGALDTLRKQLYGLVGHYCSSNVFFKRSFSSIMSNRIREISYFLNKGEKYVDTLTLVIDPQGMIYSDEYDSRTADRLAICALESCVSFDSVTPSAANYFDLVFSLKLFPDEVLDSMKNSYGILLDHYLETRRTYELA